MTTSHHAMQVMRPVVRPYATGNQFTLYVHLPCGRTVWRLERSNPEASVIVLTPLTCTLCADPAPEAWRQVWAEQPTDDR